MVPINEPAMLIVASLRVVTRVLPICGLGQRVCCVLQNKELTPKIEDVKLITRWQHAPNTIGQYFFTGSFRITPPPLHYCVVHAMGEFLHSRCGSTVLCSMWFLFWWSSEHVNTTNVQYVQSQRTHIFCKIVLQYTEEFKGSSRNNLMSRVISG